MKGKLDDAQHSLQDKFDHLRTEAAHKLDDAKAKAAELKEEATKFDELKLKQLRNLMS